MFTAAATVDDDAPVAEVESSSEQLNEALLPAEASKKDEGAKTADSGEATTASKPTTAVVKEDQGVSFAISTPTLWFQLLFCFASIYYCMLLTSWGSPDSLDEGTKLFGDTSSKLCFWIQQVAQWLTIIVYMISQTCFGEKE